MFLLHFYNSHLEIYIKKAKLFLENQYENCDNDVLFYIKLFLFFQACEFNYINLNKFILSSNLLKFLTSSEN